MRLSKLFVIVLILVSSIALAQNLTEIVTEPADTGLEILSSWQSLAILAIIISVIFVAMAYAIGIGFSMPQMEAWARSELTQVFANVVIIIALIGAVTFVDLVVMAMVTGSGLPIPCDVGDNCLKNTVNEYLDDYIDAAKGGAKETIVNNLQAAGWANRRAGLYCTVFIPCVQASFSATIVGHYVLDVDRYTLIFEYYQGLLSSLNAQKFFVNEISFKVGPLILALGIVARSFFITRRLGGSLIAIAAGIMFFFPAMYIVDWLTLDMALTGDNPFEAQDRSRCPEECNYAPPLAFYFNTTQNKDVGLNTTKEIYAMFDKNDRDKGSNILLGESVSESGINGVLISTCQIDSSKDGFGSFKLTGANDTCDRSCRELPYPHTSSVCAATAMQLACEKLPEPCKVKRIKVEVDETEYSKCMPECRIVPPMKSTCNTGDCLKSRNDCRVAKRTNLDWRPSIDSGAKGSAKCNVYPHDCVESLDAEDSCVWVMPEFGMCEDLCGGCPEECRFLDQADIPISSAPTCYDSDGKFLSACSSCPNTCRVNMTWIENVKPDTGDLNCSNCPINHRLIPGTEGLPYNYTLDTSTHSCSYDSCDPKYRVDVPRSACDSCMLLEESYTYSPPINFDCGDLCKPPENAPKKSPGDYTKVGEDGLVGREEIKAVSKLMIPAYVLPLFNIAATIIVIRSLAGILGGDIEIPGLAKIF
jgi:hypothetical protein